MLWRKQISGGIAPVSPHEETDNISGGIVQTERWLGLVKVRDRWDYRGVFRFLQDDLPSVSASAIVSGMLPVRPGLKFRCNSTVEDVWN